MLGIELKWPSRQWQAVKPVWKQFAICLGVSVILIILVTWFVFSTIYETKIGNLESTIQTHEARNSHLNEQLQYQYKDQAKNQEKIEIKQPGEIIERAVERPPISVFVKRGLYLDHKPNKNNKFNTTISFPILLVPLSIQNHTDDPVSVDIYIVVRTKEGKVQRFAAAGARTVGMVPEIQGYINAVSPLSEGSEYIFTPFEINERKSVKGKCAFLLAYGADFLVRERLRGFRYDVSLEFLNALTNKPFIEPVPLY